MKKRKLPVGGIQEFGKLRREQNLYVDKPIEDALWQLEDKDYASIYSDSGKQIAEIGVVFSREKRNIIEWNVL